MRRFVLPGLVVAAAAGLLALLTFGVTGQGDSTSIDARVAKGTLPAAPSAGMELPLLGSHRTASLASFRGKVVVLNVFASWCDPCRAEAPILAGEQRALAGHDATVVGVTYLDNTVASQQFVRREHITYPVLRDVSGDFVRSFGTTGVPETFVINRQGRIQALRRYQLSGTWLSRAVSPILGWRSVSARATRRRRPGSARSLAAHLGLAAVLLTLVSPGTALAAPRASFTQIENDLMCIACHESLAVAQSPESYSERQFLRTLIAQGLTRKQILDQMVAQYGPAVLAKPPASGFNLVIYVLPPVLVAIGVVALLIALPRWRLRSRLAASSALATTPTLDPADADRLEQDLARQP